MDFDFSALLLALTVVTGVIWLIDSIFFAAQRKQDALAEAGEAEEILVPEPIIVEYARSFFPVILIVLLLRSFIVEPFRIPSESMLPTLKIGDFILVNKFTYGIRLPVINEKIIGVGKPERGDVTVFRFPKDPSVDFIKRIVGLPGDKIEYRNKMLYINGEKQIQIPDGEFEDSGSSLRMSGSKQQIEKLGAIEHKMLVRSIGGVNNSWVVPEGHYFAMGEIVIIVMIAVTGVLFRMKI